MKQSNDKQATKIATWSELTDRQPAYALVANVDLGVIRYDEQVSVFYGRCLHRGGNGRHFESVISPNKSRFLPAPGRLQSA